MRAEEWSGPWPSWPWGRSMTSPERCPHFWVAEVTYSSMTHWAPLAKSPNWASHMVSPSGRSTA